MNYKLKTSFVAGLLIATQSYAQTQQLSTITVSSATKSEQSIKDVTSNIKVITKEEIEERHYTSLPDALNRIAGVSIVSNGGLGTSSSVYMRGNDRQRILVLIDGVRYNDVTSSNGAPFEHMMMEEIEQIEVVKGAQSGVWGADASAGVINIITKSAKKGTHGSAMVEYGSFATKKYGASLSHKTEKYSVKGSVHRVVSDGFSAFEAKQGSVNYGKRGDELGLEKDAYENTTGSVKLGYNFNDANTMEFLHTLISAKNDYDSSTADNVSNRTIIHDKFSSLIYKNSNSIAQTTLNMNRSTFDRDYSAGFLYDGTTKEYGVKTNIPYMNTNSFVLVGADYKEFEHTNNINETFTNKAVYITNSNKFNDDNTIITESLRADKYDKFDDKTTGKVGVKHYFNNEFHASVNYGTSYNVPTLYHLYSTYGNANLNPESTKGYDVQLSYKDFSVTYFNTKVKDMIDYDFSISKFGNINGESTLEGVELEYSKEVLPQTLLDLNYTHLKTRDKDDKPLRRRIKRELKFALDYYGISKLHFNLNGSYVGSRYDDANRTIQTGRYTLWNGAINYEINKNLKAYVKMENIFDKYYQTANGYATAGQSAYVGLKASF